MKKKQLQNTKALTHEVFLPVFPDDKLGPEGEEFPPLIVHS